MSQAQSLNPQLMELEGIRIPDDATIETLEAAGKYDYKSKVADRYITSQQLRITVHRHRQLYLAHFVNDVVPSQAAVNTAHQMGYAVGLIGDLLAIGAHPDYRNLQLQFPIVALGSFVLVNGDRLIPFLRGQKGKRGFFSSPNSTTFIRMIPTIRIFSSPLLSKYFQLSYSNKLQETIRDYQKAWEKSGNKLLNRLQEVTGLIFAQNYIDVYIIDSESKRAISNPMILPASLSIQEFTFCLTHELTHRVTSDNTSGVNWHTRAQKLYPAEEVLVANHIMIYAILEVTYIQLDRREALEFGIKSSQDSPAYKRAWEIVKQEGGQNIIKKLKACT